MDCINFLDLPVEIVSKIVLSSPDARSFLKWLLVCSSTYQSVSEKDRENAKVRYEAKTCDVWHYYCSRYSQTGAVCWTKEECYYHARQDGFYFDEKEVSEKILSKDEYTCFQFEISKVPFYGELSDYVHFLRYPPSVYSSERLACKRGIEHVWSKFTSGCSFYWGNSFSFGGSLEPGRSQYTKCDREWMEKISGGPKLKWKKIWEEFIENDTFSTKNHIEDIDSFRVSLLKPDKDYMNYVAQKSSAVKESPKKLEKQCKELCGAQTKKGHPCKNRKASCRYHQK